MAGRATIIISPLFQPTLEQKQAARLRMRDALQIAANRHPELFRPISGTAAPDRLFPTNGTLANGHVLVGEHHDDAA
jgi:hypothetical protein